MTVASDRIALNQTGVIDTMDRALTVTVTISGDRATLTFWAEGRRIPEYRVICDRVGCAALEQAIQDARLQLGGTT